MSRRHRNAQTCTKWKAIPECRHKLTRKVFHVSSIGVINYVSSSGGEKSVTMWNSQTAPLSLHHRSLTHFWFHHQHHHLVFVLLSFLVNLFLSFSRYNLWQPIRILRFTINSQCIQCFPFSLFRSRSSLNFLFLLFLRIRWCTEVERSENKMKIMQSSKKRKVLGFTRIMSMCDVVAINFRLQSAHASLVVTKNPSTCSTSSSNLSESSDKTQHLNFLITFKIYDMIHLDGNFAWNFVCLQCRVVKQHREFQCVSDQDETHSLQLCL